MVRFDDDVTSHLFSVTSGLESVVTGETEVVGQVRRAFERAQEEGTSGPVLSALFRHALADGQTGPHRDRDQQGHDVVRLRGRDGCPWRGPGRAARCARVVVVGAGDMGLGVCRALSDIAPDDAPQRVVVVNRSVRAGARPGAPGEYRAFRHAGRPARGRGRGAGRGRRRPDRGGRRVPCAQCRRTFTGVAGPLLVIDLGVPRNVDAAVAGLDGITLLDMDTLSVSVARALGDRQEESVAARAIVAAEVDRYRSASRQRGAAPIIASLRSRLETLRVAELERHRAQLADLSEEEWDHVDAATRAALAKMLHEPTMLLKETAGTPRGERLVEALRILFDL